MGQLLSRRHDNAPGGFRQLPSLASGQERVPCPSLCVVNQSRPSEAASSTLLRARAPKVPAKLAAGDLVPGKGHVYWQLTCGLMYALRPQTFSPSQVYPGTVGAQGAPNFQESGLHLPSPLAERLTGGLFAA